MVPIKNIGNLPPEFRRTERNEKRGQIKRPKESHPRGPTQVNQQGNNSPDQVNVSDSARTLLQRDAEVRRFSAEMPGIETISPEEQQSIEEKIESGFYASPEVISEIAGKIASTTTPSAGGLSPTRMQEVLENIRHDKYSSEQVLDVIVEKILKDL